MSFNVECDIQLGIWMDCYSIETCSKVKDVNVPVPRQPKLFGMDVTLGYWGNRCDFVDFPKVLTESPPFG